MDQTTKPSFSSRSNAKRAAEKAIADGTAPSVDYGIQPTDEGRFEIVWKTASGTSAASNIKQVEAAEAATEPERAADTAEPADPTNGPAEGELAPTAEPAAPAAAVETPAAEGALDPELAGFETERLIAHLQRLGYCVTLALARQRRSATRQARTPSGPRRSKATELDEAAARGVMPTKPEVTSHANSHYQKRFDNLAELATAGDWDGVAAYECNGVNSYAKMVRQYRDRLVAAHKAQQAGVTATEQGAAQ